MKVLIAEDDAVSRRLLEATLERAGYTVVSTDNGRAAWEVLTAPEPPRMAVLDWMMPELDGVEVCRRIRQHEQLEYVYVVVLTARGQKTDIVAGFEAGVDDYLTKPFDPLELRSRLAAGRRIIELQLALRTKVGELEHALSHVKQLQGLLPICMHCRKVRDDDATWHLLENYVQEHSGAMFTHSLCNECLAIHYPKYEHKVAAKERESR